MKVSVVVAAYNGEEFIKETLESLLSQTYDDFEIIIVDDGSTDSTANIVRSFENEKIKYFHKENSGKQATPRNYGIKKAQGEYVALCDQDDIWYPEKLERQVCIGNDEKVGLIVASADIINEHGGKTGTRYVPEGYMAPEESFQMLLDEDFITACAVLIPKKVLDEIGDLDESLSGNDDYDLWLRIARKYGIYGISEPLCAWRRSEKAFSHDMSRVFKENEKIFDKLKPNSKSEEKIIKDGANKNNVRLFVAYVKEGKYEEAKKTLRHVEPSDGMLRVKVIMRMFKISPKLAGTGIKFLARFKNQT